MESLAGFAVVVVAMVVLNYRAGKDAVSFVQFAGYLGFAIGLFVLCGLTIAIHELGHLLAGWAVGHRFSWTNIAGLVIERKDGRLQARFVKWSSETGQTSMTTGRHLPSVTRKRIEILGGLVASWACFLVAVHFVKLPGDYQYNTPEALVSSIAMMCSLISGGLLFAGLIDLFSGNERNDYRMLLNSWFSRAKFKRGLDLQYLSVRANEGVLARDWPASVLDGSVDPVDGTAWEAFGRYLRYYSFADRGDGQAAWTELGRAIEITEKVADGHITRALLDALPAERLFTAIRVLKDAELVETYKGMPHPLGSAGEAAYCRARAAFALWEGRPEHALGWITRARGFLDQLAAETKAANERLWLDEMEAEARG